MQQAGSNRLRAWLVAAAVAAMTVPGTVLALELPVLGKDIFGIQLGEQVDAVRAKCSAVALEYVNDTEKPDDVDFPGVTDDIYGCLNGNGAVSKTRISHYGGRIYQVELYFKDTSVTNLSVLQDALAEKYGKPESSLFDAFASQFTYHARLDGQEVDVVLDPRESGDLTLRYRYLALAKTADDAMAAKKAARVKGDL